MIACAQPIGMHCKMLSRSRMSKSDAMYWCIIRSALSRAFFDTDNIYCNDIPTAYHDLLETEPCKLLNLNMAAFAFVSDSQFTHSRYA